MYLVHGRSQRRARSPSTATRVTAVPAVKDVHQVFGQPQFEDINSFLNDRFAALGTLIAVHRGTGIGSIVENTSDAVTAAVASGGDIVEIDVVASTDGDFFAFHDGYERRLLGVGANLRTMSTAQINDLSYRHVARPGRPARVEPLLDLLSNFRGRALFNIDRSWCWWPALLRDLDALNMTGQLLLKSPAGEDQVQFLREHPVKYPFLPICRTLEESFSLLDDPRLNTVGVELVAEHPSHPFVDPRALAGLRERGVFTFANAEVLTTGIDLFAGYDDETAILRSPDLGWGPLFDLGVDVIQTDWPWLLRDYRKERVRAASAVGPVVINGREPQGNR